PPPRASPGACRSCWPISAPCCCNPAAGPRPGVLLPQNEHATLVSQALPQGGAFFVHVIQRTLPLRRRVALWSALGNVKIMANPYTPQYRTAGLLDARRTYESARQPHPDAPWLLAFQPRQRPELELPLPCGGRPAAGARRAPARRPARADASPGPGPVGPGRPLSAAVRT